MPTKTSAKVSSIVMGLLFLLPGIIKTVSINSQLYKEMLRSYKNLTEVSPIRYIGITPNPRTYMQALGALELIFGTTLIVGVTVTKRIACLGLMLLMLVTTFTHLSLKDYNGMIVPCGYFGLLSWVYVCLGRKHTSGKDKTE